MCWYSIIIKSNSQKINQKAMKLLLIFRLDALALLRVIMTDTQENSQTYTVGYIGVKCHCILQQILVRYVLKTGRMIQYCMLICEELPLRN